MTFRLLNPIIRLAVAVMATPFGKTFIGFIVAQAFFLLFARFESIHGLPFAKKWVLPLGIERAQTMFFIVCVHLLVAVNTAIFIVHSLKPHRHFSKLKQDLQPAVERNYHRFVWTLIGSVVISTIIMTLIVIGNALSLQREWWQLLLTLNELLTIVLFSAFLLADQWCLEACSIALGKDSELDESGRRDLEPFANDLRFYLLACDGPGLCGIIVITIMSVLLHSSLAGYYWEGFVTGAIGLHIAYSQSALAFLSTQRNAH